ncbi:hypothetical protein EDB19DRAFT_1832915 [Suillus lakei]|nr:hypothetical protein EDB19DRAFT_1832915 [Suillus lakei]
MTGQSKVSTPSTTTQSMWTLRKFLNDVLNYARAGANVDAALNRLMNGSSTELFDNLVHDFKASTDIESCIQAITTLLVKVEELRQQVQECHCATLQCLGVGKELRQVELTAGRVDDVNKALEDVLMHAMDDIHSLFYHHAQDYAFLLQDMLALHFPT